MAKRNNQQNQSVMVIALLLVALFIGGSVFAVLVGKNPAGTGGAGGTTGGSQSSSQSGSFERDVETLTQQVYDNPNDINVKERLGIAYFNLANEYKQANDPRANATFGETIRIFKEVVAAKPNSKESLGDLATALFYTDQVDEAIVTVQKALEVDPNFYPARMNYAIYLGFGKGDYAAGIKELEKVPSGTSQYEQAQSLIQEFKNAAK